MIHFVFKEPGSPDVLGPPRELFAVWCNAMLSCAIWCNSKSPKHGCKEVDLKEKFCPQKENFYPQNLLFAVDESCVASHFY
jgi:hypothetical protein